MGDPALERELPDDEIGEMIRLIRSNWTLRASEFMEDGVSAIYRVSVDTRSGVEAYYLKATPVLPGEDLDPRVDAEARLTECVRRHTEIPVPTVIGAVDAHEDVRTPFFLMEAMPGHDNDMEVLVDLPTDSMAALAHETGRYLGQLHAMETPNVTRFGKGVTFDAESSLTGGRPSGDPSELTFPDGYASWRDRMADWIEDDLDALAAVDRFQDLVAPIERSLTELVDRIPEPARPIVGRVDQGLWNVLTTRSCRSCTAWLDWGSLFAVPPAFDLAVVEYFLGGGPWMALGEVADYRTDLKDALLEGYQTERRLPDQFELQRRCYRLDTIVVTLAGFASDERKPRHLPDDRVDEAAAGMRREVEDLVTAE
ncbi:MAG: phosphotransferase [Halobacteriales archaeon]|nr:phosphotransferase [Halobacteriales archaeon]